MDYPQIVTTIMEGLAPVSSVVDAPWVTVTSINGMTGDVIVEPIIKPFQSNHYYLKDSVVTYNGAICIAKQTFTSGESFNANDWDMPDLTQEQADWNEDDSTAKSYIKNKPTIPTVNNGTLTIQKNGSNVATFSANTATNTTANISVPTKTSEITNDSDFIKSSDLPTVNNGVLTIQKNGTMVDTFTANSATNKTVNIETITAETVAPAEEVGAITTNTIADEAVTASKVDPTSFAVLVYVGEIAYGRTTYNNSLIPLTDKIDFYKASGISSAITSSTNLVMTLPTDGTYIARVKASLWTNGNSWDYMLMAIRKNGNGFARAMGPKISGAWGFVNVEGYTTIANGDAISVYLNTNGNNFSDGNITRQDSKLIVEIYKVG